MKTGWKSIVVTAVVLSVGCSVVLAGYGGPERGRGRAARPEGQGMGPGPQARGQMAPGAGERLGQIIRQLDLTQEQRTQIRGVLSQGKTDAQATREAVAKAHEDLRSAVAAGATEEQIRSAGAAIGTAIGNQAALHAKTLASVKAVLTNEQRSKLEQLLKDRPPVRGGARNAAVEGRRGGPQRLRNAPNGEGRPGPEPAAIQGRRGGPQRLRNGPNGPAGEGQPGPGPAAIQGGRGGPQRMRNGPNGPAGPGPAPFRRFFNAADTNRDGMLTLDEFRAFEQTRQGGGPQPRP